jgi:hypothetical protein
MSRLFFNGNAGGIIEKIAQRYFFKVEKAAAVQVRCPPAAETKAFN